MKGEKRSNAARRNKQATVQWGGGERKDPKDRRSRLERGRKNCMQNGKNMGERGPVQRTPKGWASRGQGFAILRSQRGAIRNCKGKKNKRENDGAVWKHGGCDVNPRLQKKNGANLPKVCKTERWPQRRKNGIQKEEGTLPPGTAPCPRRGGGEAETHPQKRRLAHVGKKNKGVHGFHT